MLGKCRRMDFNVFHPLIIHLNHLLNLVRLSVLVSRQIPKGSRILFVKFSWSKTFIRGETPWYPSARFFKHNICMTFSSIGPKIFLTHPNFFGPDHKQLFFAEFHILNYVLNIWSCPNSLDMNLNWFKIVLDLFGCHIDATRW